MSCDAVLNTADHRAGLIDGQQSGIQRGNACRAGRYRGQRGRGESLLRRDGTLRPPGRGRDTARKLVHPDERRGHHPGGTPRRPGRGLRPGSPGLGGRHARDPLRRENHAGDRGLCGLYPGYLFLRWGVDPGAEGLLCLADGTDPRGGHQASELRKRPGGAVGHQPRRPCQCGADAGERRYRYLYRLPDRRGGWAGRFVQVESRFRLPARHRHDPRNRDPHGGQRRHSQRDLQCDAERDLRRRNRPRSYRLRYCLLCGLL